MVFQAAFEYDKAAGRFDCDTDFQFTIERTLNWCIEIKVNRSFSLCISVMRSHLSEVPGPGSFPAPSAAFAGAPGCGGWSPLAACARVSSCRVRARFIAACGSRTAWAVGTPGAAGAAPPGAGDAPYGPNAGGRTTETAGAACAAPVPVPPTVGATTPDAISSRRAATLGSSAAVGAGPGPVVIVVAAGAVAVVVAAVWARRGSKFSTVAAAAAAVAAAVVALAAGCDGSAGAPPTCSCCWWISPWKGASALGCARMAGKAPAFVRRKAAPAGSVYPDGAATPGGGFAVSASVDAFAPCKSAGATAAAPTDGAPGTKFGIPVAGSCCIGSTWPLSEDGCTRGPPRPAFHKKLIFSSFWSRSCVKRDGSPFLSSLYSRR
jgi:hypothetical protein